MMGIKPKLFLLVFLLIPFTLSINVEATNPQIQTKKSSSSVNLKPNLYDPTFDAWNVKEQMTLSPMFTPDNAIDLHAGWIAKANSTIDLQNQYVTQWDDNVDWNLDPSPLVKALVEAKSRGVAIRVQIRGDKDSNGIVSDGIADYLIPLGIEVKYMGNADTADSDGYWLSATHNKMILIDNKVSLISSINFGENAFTNNREAGMIIQSLSVTNYYKDVFDSDWDDGETPITTINIFSNHKTSEVATPNTYTSHTTIPKTNFTGVYNVTAFVNPDNADKVIFDYLKSAKESIFVSMYTISREDFADTLIDLKKANPSVDIQVLISNRRVNGDENEDTFNEAKSLVDNLIPVYNSTKDDDKVDGFYHNKYWIIDGKHTFIYSGNWSPKSATPAIADGQTYASGEPNRDMGIAIHDAPDIASFIKTEVWDKDVAVSDEWDLGIGIKQLSFEDSQVISGKVELKAQVLEIEGAAVSYKFGSNSFTDVVLINNQFQIEVDTLELPNGITTFEVKAELNEQVFDDKVTVNIVNYGDSQDWRFLITEVLPDPDVVDDSDGEFIELTNSFPFDLIISKWKIGDDDDVLEFPDDASIEAYSSIIIARNSDGFKTGYGKNADYQLGIELTNSGDIIVLTNQRDETVDAIAYGSKVAPDGSEVLDKPEGGVSIQRSPLHVDTNLKSDFIYTAPNPKGDVPKVGISDSETEESFGFTFIAFIISIGAIITIHLRKRRSLI